MSEHKSNDIREANLKKLNILRSIILIILTNKVNCFLTLTIGENQCFPSMYNQRLCLVEIFYN